MICPLELERSAELVVGYSARTLDPETAAAFERHMDCCATCCELAAAQRAVWAALDDADADAEWPSLRVSAEFDRRLFQRIERAENRRWWWRTLIPATACLALAAAFLFRQAETAGAPRKPQPQPALQIEQVEHALDDMDLLKQLGAAI